MALSGSQIEQLLQALLRAYLSKEELEIMVKTKLNRDLNTIVDGGDLTWITFKLIMHADSNGYVHDLVDGAAKGNPGNKELQKVVNVFDGWLTPMFPRDTVKIYQPILSTQPESETVSMRQTNTDLFWEVLSDEVVVLLGAESTQNLHMKSHPAVSPRDFAAITEVIHYLASQPSIKNVRVFLTTDGQWKNHVRSHKKADLIIIGGFITNDEFRRYSQQIVHRTERTYELKMGQVCRFKGKRVFQIKFDESDMKAKGIPIPTSPQEREEAPSDYVTKDYGFVHSTFRNLYGSDRRVITFSGVKGHGTHAAAFHMVRGTIYEPRLDSVLSSHFTDRYTLEMVIGVDVGDAELMRTQIVEVALNKEIIMEDPLKSWEGCNLDTDCNMCEYGLKLTNIPCG